MAELFSFEESGEGFSFLGDTIKILFQIKPGREPSMVVRGILQDIQDGISRVFLQVIEIGRDSESEGCITVLRGSTESVEFGNGFDDFILRRWLFVGLQSFQGTIDFR